MDWYIDYLFFPLFGLVWIIAGIYRWRKSLKLSVNGKKTTGIIHDFVDSGPIEDTSVSPVVRFKTLETGEFITQQLDFSSSLPVYKLGQKINIIYDPADPTRVSVDSSFLQEWTPRLLVGFGLAIFIYGIYRFNANP